MISRRRLIQLGAGAIALAANPLAAQRFIPRQPLKPGEFTWTPEASPSGPVVLIVSIPEQMVHVYRNGIEIGASACSTGKPGHRTPTGVFTILEKERKHTSSIYKGASMPNMERLTWGGIALHAGNMPGYPASHGCIRLPMKFSALLYDVTHLGVVVIIADEHTQPGSVAHPGIMLSSVAKAEARALAQTVVARKSAGSWDTTVRYPVSSVVISRADGRAYVTRDGVMQGAYPVGFAQPSVPLGTHVYSLVGPAADDGELTWLAFGVGKSPKDAHIVRWQGDAALRRIVFRDRKRALAIAQTFHPGSTLVVTDSPAPQPTRSTPKGFSVIASDAA